MKEITGDLWEYFGEDRKEFVVCITTNGTVKRDGRVVMGRGCAAEAAGRLRELPKLLGEALVEFGNIVLQPYGADLEFEECRLLTFPVKHNWWEKADLELIERSVGQLAKLAVGSDYTFILPRPGCGNGKLRWGEVKPLLKGLPDNVWVISKEGE